MPVTNFNYKKCEKCGDSSVACDECCDHEWDDSEGGMCINCGREDYYNFVNEDDPREDR